MYFVLYFFRESNNDIPPESTYATVAPKNITAPIKHINSLVISASVNLQTEGNETGANLDADVEVEFSLQHTNVS